MFAVTYSHCETVHSVSKSPKSVCSVRLDQLTVCHHFAQPFPPQSAPAAQRLPGTRYQPTAIQLHRPIVRHTARMQRRDRNGWGQRLPPRTEDRLRRIAPHAHARMQHTRSPRARTCRCAVTRAYTHRHAPVSGAHRPPCTLTPRLFIAPVSRAAQRAPAPAVPSVDLCTGTSGSP